MSCPVYDITNPTVMHIEMAEVRRLRSALEAQGICTRRFR